MIFEQRAWMLFYILDENHNIVCVGDDVERWAEMFGRRGVAHDEISEDIMVSTVFLGIDHGIPTNPRRPIVFETMIFRNGEDDDCWRCATWDEALAQHKKAVEL